MSWKSKEKGALKAKKAFRKYFSISPENKDKLTDWHKENLDYYLGLFTKTRVFKKIWYFRNWKHTPGVKNSFNNMKKAEKHSFYKFKEEMIEYT